MSRGAGRGVGVALAVQTAADLAQAASAYLALDEKRQAMKAVQMEFEIGHEMRARLIEGYSLLGVKDPEVKLLWQREFIRAIKN